MADIQTNVLAALAYKAETTFGVAPTATGAKYLRRVSANLNTQKDAFASNEARTDFQVADLRHGGRSARGTIECELSTETYDDFMEALLRGTWTTGVSAAPAQFATGVTITTVGATSTLTFAGAGNLLTIGFKIGDVVRATGLTQTVNNNRNLRIVALTGTEMTVTPAITASAQQAAGWAVAVAGRKLLCGVNKRSFTIEQRLAEAEVFELFTGCRVGGMSLNITPSGMTSVTWEVQGLNGGVDSTEYFTTPTAETSTGVVSGIDGSLRVAGAERAIVTGLQVNITNNLSSTPVIGSTVVPEIFYGRTVVTGSLSAYFDGIDLLNAFLNETEIEVVAQLNGAGAEPKPFLAFSMPRVKLSAGNKTIGPDGGVILQAPFQALLPTTGGAGTAYDLSTLSIQRSNT